MVSGNVASMDITSLTEGFTNLATIVSQAMGTIAGNDVLMAVFACGILGVGFRVIHMAKKF